MKRFLFHLIVCLCGVCQAAPEPPTSEELRILTYNIHMWEPGLEALTAVIKKSNADIIALSESWNGDKNEALAKNLGYNIAYGGKEPTPAKEKKAHWINDHYMPQVLLTKHRIISSTYFNAKAAEEDPTNRNVDPTVPIYRGGTLVELETAKGNRIVVFALHLHPWGDANNEKMTSMRLAEIKGIMSKLQPHTDKPLLIMGDFNTQSHLEGKMGWKVTPYLESEKLSDLYRTLHPDPATHPGLTWPDSRIDYIFHNDLLTPLESRVVEKGIFGSGGYDSSDHLALFAVVRVGGKK